MGCSLALLPFPDKQSLPGALGRMYNISEMYYLYFIGTISPYNCSDIFSLCSFLGSFFILLKIPVRTCDLQGYIPNALDFRQINIFQFIVFLREPSTHSVPFLRRKPKNIYGVYVISLPNRVIRCHGTDPLTG